MYARMLLLFTSPVVREQIYDVMEPNEFDSDKFNFNENNIADTQCFLK